MSGEMIKDLSQRARALFDSSLIWDAHAGFETPPGMDLGCLDEWKRLYQRRPAQLSRNIAGQYITYATGAPPRFSDRETIRDLVEHAKPKNYGVRSLLHSVIASDIFLNK